MTQPRDVVREFGTAGKPGEARSRVLRMAAEIIRLRSERERAFRAGFRAAAGETAWDPEWESGEWLEFAEIA